MRASRCLNTLVALGAAAALSACSSYGVLLPSPDGTMRSSIPADANNTVGPQYNGLGQPRAGNLDFGATPEQKPAPRPAPPASAPQSL